MTQNQKDTKRYQSQNPNKQPSLKTIEQNTEQKDQKTISKILAEKEGIREAAFRA